MDLAAYNLGAVNMSNRKGLCGHVNFLLSHFLKATCESLFAKTSYLLSWAITENQHTTSAFAAYLIVP